MSVTYEICYVDNTSIKGEAKLEDEHYMIVYPVVSSSGAEGKCVSIFFNGVLHNHVHGPFHCACCDSTASELSWKIPKSHVDEHITGMEPKESPSPKDPEKEKVQLEEVTAALSATGISEPQEETQSQAEEHSEAHSEKSPTRDEHSAPGSLKMPGSPSGAGKASA